MMNKLNPVIPRFISPEKVLCGFTTRSGGVSPEPFDTLNLGFKTPDERTNVTENRQIFYRYAGIDEDNIACMGQIHRSAVRIVTRGGVYEGTDGLLTAHPGIMLGVLVADCIPLLLYDPVHDVIGAIHCGWCSTVNNIAGKALGMMTEHFTTDPGELITVLGPSAGPCCYRVGEDVARYLDPGSIRTFDGSVYADLRAELTGRLVKAGVDILHIEIFNDCTICNESLYFSFRRDGIRSGRMLGYIMVKGKKR